MDYRLQVSYGINLITYTAIIDFFNELYPVLSFIGVTCGAILGLHGVYLLLKGKYKGERT